MMIEALEDIEEGVRVGGELVKDVKFADGQGMVAGTEIGLQGNSKITLNNIIKL